MCQVTVKRLKDKKMMSDGMHQDRGENAMISVSPTFITSGRLQSRRAKGHHLTQKNLIVTRRLDHNDHDRWNEERQNKRSGTREASGPLTAWYA